MDLDVISRHRIVGVDKERKWTMKGILTVLSFACLISATYCQTHLTGKDIYRTNCGAIVQIFAGNELGVGFITSADGQIMTANHVVATPQSGFRQYAEQIQVKVAGRSVSVVAKPINEAPSQDQINYDSAVIKITATGLPHVTLGDWKGVDIGDTVTILPTFPGFGCMLLQGTVAGKGPLTTVLGPRPVNTIIFQAPIRNGFSGSPIFGKDGRVIGIEDTKVFGISPALGALRDQWQSTTQNGQIRMFGIDIAGSFLQTINNLDQNLISGLGSGVAIEYAKDLAAGGAGPHK